MLTPKEIKLVQDSWEIINPVSRKMGEEFYVKLFEDNPEMKAMFKSDPQDQAMKLIFMLSFLVHRLDNVDEMRLEISKLASRHKNYGTSPNHYKPLGDALIWSLKQNLGNKWTQETEAAWSKTYDLISNLMMEEA